MTRFLRRILFGRRKMRTRPWRVADVLDYNLRAGYLCLGWEVLDG